MRSLKSNLLLCAAFIGSILIPMQCGAMARCPWLNSATAAGVLGGEVLMSVTPATTGGAVTCEFSRQIATGTTTLRIDVSTLTNIAPEFALYRSRCVGSLVSLRAIGNEAYLCVQDHSHGAGVEQIVGRVRDRAFTLTISRKVIAPVPPNAREPSPDARNMAEQIAGVLF